MSEEYSESNIVYTIDSLTCEYLQESDAIFDPELSKIKGKNLYRAPEFSTFTEPPTTKENEVAVYINEQWDICKDFRGSIYYENDGTPVSIKNIGDEIPDWGVLIPPPEEFQKPLYDNGKWIETYKETLMYKGHEVFDRMGVNIITTKLLNGLNEDKAKTEKMISGDNPCPEWEEFLVKRQELLDEGRKFKQEHFPKSNEK